MERLLKWTSENKIKIVDLFLGVPNEEYLVLDFSDVEKFNVFNFVDSIKKGRGTYLTGKCVKIHTTQKDNNIFEFRMITEHSEEPLLEVFLEYTTRGYEKKFPKREQLSILVKPTCDCNLNCLYCYDVGARRKFKGKRLSVDDIDRMLFLLSNFVVDVTWIWHGGEVLLMGKEWFKEVYSRVFPKYPMLNINHSLVSNAILWDDEWVDIMNTNKIGMSTSFNAGNQCSVREAGLHNNLVQISTGDVIADIEQDATNSIVWHNIHNAKTQYHNEIGVIDVVTSECLPKLVQISEFYKKHDIPVVFNDCFDTESTKKNTGIVSSQNTYEYWVEEFIKYWIKAENNVPQSRFIDSIVEILTGFPSLCHFGDCRESWIGLHPDGSITPCDRETTDEYIYGYIWKIEDLSDIYTLSQGFQNYSKGIDRRYEKYCKPCGHLKWCGGGCNGTVIENNNGDVSGIYKQHCYTTKHKMRLVYKYIREIDVFDESINEWLRDFYLRKFIYPIPEIKEYFSELGVSLEIPYNPNVPVAFDEEFELFDDICTQVTKYIHSHYGIEELKHNKETRRTLFFNVIKKLNMGEICF